MRRWLALLLLVLASCEGAISGARVDRSADAELPAPSSRAPRLSQAQYENTVKDLLGASAPLGLTASFVGDATSGTFDNLGGELQVGADQWTDFQRSAEEVARQATLSTTALTAVAGGALPTDTAELVRALGRRTLRRALTADEVTSYVALAAQGPTFYASMTAQLAGARLVLEAMLQSPAFLYLLELSDTPRDGVIPLSGDELAVRLSYALWQTMPDAQLFAAAQAGTLLTTDGYRAQVERLLADARAREVVGSFHDQLMQVRRYSDLSRATNLFPEFVPALRASMVAEERRFVQAVVFDDRGGLNALLTAPYTFADGPLAAVYKLTGVTGSGLTKVTFTDGKRGGLLTQVGFLTANATSTEPDPIHRGVFVNHRLLCANLPPPPNNVPPLPAPDPAVKRTLRERITTFTGVGTCGAGCHSTMINPIGFAYEHYDALGRWRDVDNTLPVDAADSYSFEGARSSFDGAVGLGAVMAQQPMTHRCYAQHWLEFLAGRPIAPSDAAVIKRVATASLQQQAPVTDVVQALVLSQTFTARPVEQP